jgi:hypothetical protein
MNDNQDLQKSKQLEAPMDDVNLNEKPAKEYDEE